MFGAILAAAGGVAKGIMGAVQASKAKKAIESYQRQDLTNVMDGVSVSTKGAEYAQEQLSQSASTAMHAIQAGGVRGVVGATSKIVGTAVDSAQKVGAGIDEQQKAIDLARAQDETRIQDMQERREEADLAGLGQQRAVGQQNLFSGISDVASAGSSIVSQGKANKEAGLGFWGNK